MLELDGLSVACDVPNYSAWLSGWCAFHYQTLANVQLCAFHNAGKLVAQGVGCDYAERAVRSEQPLTALNKAFDGQRRGIACVSAVDVGRNGVFGEIGRIRYNQIVALPCRLGKGDEVGLEGIETVGPRRFAKVLFSLCHSLGVDVEGVDGGKGVPLGNHQGNHTTACANVEHASCALALGTRPNEHAVGGDGHWAFAMMHAELLKPE